MKKSHIFKIGALFTCLALAVCTATGAFAATSESDTDKIVDLRIVQDHPGIPGYDAEYEFVAYYGEQDDMERLDEDQYTLTTEIPQVKVNGSKIIVPASFKDKTDVEGFKVFATLKSNRKKVGFYPMTVKNWKKTFDDEFDGTELDASKWTVDGEKGSSANEYNPGYSIGNGKTCAVSPDAVSVEDGKLVMRVIDGTGATMHNQGAVITADFATSNLSTFGKFSQRFGCFMSSIKLSDNKKSGQNTAFWLLPQSGGWGSAFLFSQRSGRFADKVCGEIDIEEYSPVWGETGQYISQSTEHWWNSDDLVKFASGGENKCDWITDKVASGGYVNFATVWNEHTLYTYIEGKLFKVTKNLEAVEGEHAFIILGNAAGGYKSNAWVGSFDESSLSGMISYVDYCRVYQ